MASESVVGIVVGEAKPHYFHCLARRAMATGEYVVVNSPTGKLLGLAEDSMTRSLLLERVDNFESAIEAKKAVAKNPRDKNYVAAVRVVGELEELKAGHVVLPSLPPEPGTDVEAATSSDIAAVFNRTGRQWVTIGTLLRNKEVEVSVNLDAVSSKHLAILSVTGSGKSNLLALLAKRIAGLRGTMIVFDYHGEYSELRIPNLVHVDAKVNPRNVDPDKLADLIDVRSNAEVQRAVLSRALTDDVRKAKDFWKSLRDEIAAQGKEKNKAAAERLEDIISLALRRMGSVLDPDVGDELDQIRVGNVNILNMLEFTEPQANVAISHYMEEILYDRKKATRGRGSDSKVRFPAPVVCAIEEAHAFIPADRDTDTKYIAAKVAREGRKFGVSLIAVSQRPRRLDPDVLSQMGSLAIMKLTNPEDQNHIREASESVSEDLLKNLPSMNVGEAVLVGNWVNIPAVVKVEFVKEKTTGADISATELWAGAEKMKTIAKESTRSAMRLD